MSNNQKVVWITGAGSGIGKALCVEYARSGWTVILSGRNTAALQETEKICKTHGAETKVIKLDLTSEDSVLAAIEEAKKHFSKIDLLINNGGVSQRALVTETPMEVDRMIFETNYFGTVLLTKNVLSWMLKTGGGRLAVVSSISGLFGFPLRASYSASKHAVVGYFETIELENFRQNIRTSVVFPGRIKTDISINALLPSGEKQNTMDPGQEKGMSADRCAQKIRKGLSRGKRRIYVGGSELLMIFFHRYLPPLFRRIAVKIDPR
ncbi:MAG: SDR family NAD(P)-dependent oxidoreductase [Bacteroidetes bacterium]|nr:SDR family NAD(P)-dependent oxidoreductase [Bacteroidota bacterium]